ncbi:DUF1345 domain-containing protein [Kribbella sp. NPDC006257]|uniref:DUF1345 domain-containing protein n=1 Tax=Kribbella sp. NPDC006257 TaxID=3156738 RepID=UPI0033BCA595
MLAVRVDALVRALLPMAGIALLVILWIVGGGTHLLTLTLGGWDVLALLFLARQVLLMRRGSGDLSDDEVPSWVLSARAIRPRYGALLVASGAGLSAGLLIVTLDSFTPEEALASDSVVRILAAATVVLAWLILHTGYAMHYATLYFSRGRGLSFPGTTLPNFLDFAYFSFAIGAAFATSDVEVCRRPIRHAVLWHSVLSFFYNAAVLGIAISTFTGK